jgi:hypothetical protein
MFAILHSLAQAHQNPTTFRKQPGDIKKDTKSRAREIKTKTSCMLLFTDTIAFF